MRVGTCWMFCGWGMCAHSRCQRQMAIGPNKCQALFIFTWRLHNVVIKILVSRLAPLLSRASHCLARGWDSAGAGWWGEGIKGGHQGRTGEKRCRVVAATARPAGRPPRRRPRRRLAAAVPPWPPSE